VFKLNIVYISLFNLNLLKLTLFNRHSPQANGSASEDDSSEDGCVGDVGGVDTGRDESDNEDADVNILDDAPTKKDPPRESLICYRYDPPILTFDSSDWRGIQDSSGRHFAIGVNSFNKNTEYYTKNNSPADVFGALTFMMSATLEHHSVDDEKSGLIDALLVQIKQSSYPKDSRTPESIHTNCFGKVNKIFCRFVIEYIAMSLYFDYWGEHSAASGPAPYNSVSTCPILLYIKLNVAKLNVAKLTIFNFNSCTVFRTKLSPQISTMVFAGIC